MDKRYHGKPCRRCGQTLKYRANKTCVECERVRMTTLRIKVCRKKSNKKCKDKPARRASRVLASAKTRAKLHGIEFNLEPWIIEARVMHGVCEKTGLPFDFGPPPEGCKTNPWAPSLDRIDNSRGYVIDNVQIVCNIFNLAKNDFPEHVVYALAQALMKHKSMEN